MVSAIPAPLLTARSLVLAKVESTYNTDSAPTPVADAFLCSAVDVRINPNVLERKNYRPFLSPNAVIVGRKLVQVTMTHEIKSSGTVGVAPKISTLLKGCGFAISSVTSGASNQINVAGRIGTLGADISFAKTTAPTAKFGSYRLTCTTGGVAASAKVRVTQFNGYDPDATVLPGEDYTVSVSDGAGTTASWDLTALAAPVLTIAGTPADGDVIGVVAGSIPYVYTVVGTMTAAAVATAIAALLAADARFVGTAASSGVITVAYSAGAGEVAANAAITLGSSGAVVTPTPAGTSVMTDSWVIDLFQIGIRAKPVSDNFQSLTIHVFFDGMLHKVTGCMGSVVFKGDAGNFGDASFTFTGQYVEPKKQALPSTSVFEGSKPQQVELARLALAGDPYFCAQSFSIDMKNTVTPRDCVNGTDGFNGVRMTARSPDGQVNPEMQLPTDHPFHRHMANADVFGFHVNVGTVAGNIVHFLSNSTQYSGLTYGDRNGIRTVDVALRFSAFSGAGDDELNVIFC